MSLVCRRVSVTVSCKVLSSPARGSAHTTLSSTKVEFYSLGLSVDCAARFMVHMVCSRGAQRVLRYGDMKYVMLHLIFIYLMPGEGQPAAHAASDL